MQTPPNLCPQCHSPIPADAPGGLCPACVLLGVAGRTNPSQAAAAAAPTAEEVAAAFPEMEVLEVLGQGGMGIVFKARQPRLDRFVALKILPPALAAHPGFAERFTREARVLARLAHANIVSIYDFGERAGFFYLIMEFVNGVNLRAAMRAGVTPEQALLLVPRICEALQFAHDHGVLHRDIKPENILLDTAGTPKLADFGIAKLAGEEAGRTGLTATGHALGTAVYMAPEQVEKPATVDHRADIYSLGVVLYEMLTGELPLGRFAAPSEKSTVDQGVDDVVMRALEKERERRQQSAKDFKTQVEGASHPGVPFMPRVSGAVGAAVKEEPLVKRVLLALCALCAVGIPLTGMMGWDSPNPREMVVLTILFGTLAGLSKMFTAEIDKLMASRVAGAPAAPDPTGKGRTWAIRGLRLIIGSAVVFVLTLPLIWLSWDSRHGGISDGARLLLIAIGGVLILTSGWGFVAMGVALFRYRFRARWFFWCVNGMALVLLLAFGRELVITSVICLGVIGYSVFFYREFFSAATASPATTSVPTDPAPNPWPHRLFWLIASLVVLPPFAMFCAVLVPRLTMVHNNLGTHWSGWIATLCSLLPFVAGAALYYGYRRTQPGADRATPRATWNPWPQRAFWLVVALIGVPGFLVGMAVALPMIAYRGAERPVPVAFAYPPTSSHPAMLPPTPVVGAAPAAMSAPPTPGAPPVLPSPIATTPAVLPAGPAPIRPVPGTPPAVPTPITDLQEANIRLARERLNAVKESVDKAVVSRSELTAAERDLAIAEARGDEVKTATILSKYAESQLALMQELARAATVSREQVMEAERAFNDARIKLEQARSKPAAAPAPMPGVAPMTPAKNGGTDLTRLQDENIRLAEERLKETKARLENGAGTPLELVAAERNLAVAQARDDELKIATALVVYTETRYNILKAQVQQGAATPLEGLDAEQELNTARLRLEKARSATPPGPAVENETPASNEPVRR